MNERTKHTGITSMQDWEQVILKKSDIPKQTYVESNSNLHSDEIVLKKPSINFQKTLQQARLAQKMSQKDLALKAGIQLNFIQNYENGKEIPSNLIISKLEKLLNTKLPRIYK